MIGVRIERQTGTEQNSGDWFDEAIDPAVARVWPQLDATESDHFRVHFECGHSTEYVFRIAVGDLLLASTDPNDRDRPVIPGVSASRSECQGRFLIDWVGITEFTISQRTGTGDWRVLLVLPLAVTAGKILHEEFEQLFADLAREAAELLLDIHGKTQIGLKRVQGMTSASPIAALARLRETVRELREAWPALARRPACRLRMTVRRELAMAGQSVSEGTLAEIARDPGMVRPFGNDYALYEHLREDPRPDYRIPEHRTLADFLLHLQGQLAELRPKLESEIRWREGRKAWRNHAHADGQATWWQSDDQPRIEELKRYLPETRVLAETLRRLGQAHFLPPGRPLAAQPATTPRFQHVPHYRRLFQAIDRHFLSFQITFETQSLLSRVRSLPVLYELWCTVRVLRILSRGLRRSSAAVPGSNLVRTATLSTNTQFSLDLVGNRAVDFEDAQGNRVRFRYQPEYRTVLSGVGLLDGATLRTPDMALEFFASTNHTPTPDGILILDAKYTHIGHLQKLAELAQKYGRIGDPRTGRVLSRHVWALTPAEAGHRGDRTHLKSFATTDNLGFWSADFDEASPVNGALETRPTRPGAYDPLRQFLVKLLRHAGIDWQDGSGEVE